MVRFVLPILLLTTGQAAAEPIHLACTAPGLVKHHLALDLNSGFFRQTYDDPSRPAREFRIYKQTPSEIGGMELETREAVLLDQQTGRFTELVYQMVPVENPPEHHYGWGDGKTRRVEAHRIYECSVVEAIF